MSTIPTRIPGPKTSEFWALIGSWLALLGIPGVQDPLIQPNMVWPTTAMACTYMLARAWVKAAGARGDLLSEDPATGTGALARVVKGAGAVLLALVMLGGCKALGDVLDQPVAQEQVTVQTEDGTQVTGQPVPQEGPAIEAELPDGSKVSVTQAEPANPTGWDMLINTGSGVLGAVTGQPALATAAGILLTGLVARRRQKKAPAA